MLSKQSKVLHWLAGWPVLGHVAATAAHLKPAEVIIVTNQNTDAMTKIVQDACDCPVTATVQDPPLGTGHAVQCATPFLASASNNPVLILYGDTPLLRVETLQTLLAEHQQKNNSITVMGMTLPEPGAYGRLVTSANGDLERIVEFKDATPEERKITLCNSGVMVIARSHLHQWLQQLTPANASGEYYLTDLIHIARAEDHRCGVMIAPADELEGINTRTDLVRAEAALQQRYRTRALAQGVTLVDPNTVYFSADTQLAMDVLIHPFVTFGPGVTIAEDVEVLSFCALEHTTIERGAVIGPYARMRGHCHIGPAAEIGNFVEVKNTTFAANAKAKHLSYIGDATVGQNSNIGAGTITCNYNGYKKFSTTIGQSVMIGSNTALVAPVTVHDGAYVAAGSVITDDVPADSLAIARTPQEIRTSWACTFREKQGLKK